MRGHNSGTADNFVAFTNTKKESLPRVGDECQVIATRTRFCSDPPYLAYFSSSPHLVLYL